MCMISVICCTGIVINSLRDLFPLLWPFPHTYPPMVVFLKQGVDLMCSADFDFYTCKIKVHVND